MNLYFYKLFIPYTILSLVGIYFVILDPHLLFWTLGFWIFTGMIGTSIGFHRLFSHRQFETYRIIEIILAILGTLTAYGPLLFWVASHQAHHKYTDTEKDPTTPSRGFWHSALTWNLKKGCENEVVLKAYPVISILKDSVLVNISKYFFSINYLFFLLLIITLGPKIAVSGYILSTFIERIRIGFFVNYLLHTKCPGSYKVDNSTDKSVNCFIFYPLTAGFSFHNRHHSFPKESKEKTRWYEIDLEYFICKIISKK